jgi:hypothetical protein
LLLYSSKPSLGVYQLAGHFTSSTLPIKFSSTIITEPSATYQRCMHACLKEQIGRNIEVYVDDIVIKMVKADSLLDDL